eukprot:g81574.t1
MMMHASSDECEVVSLVMRCHGERAIRQCMFAHVTSIHIFLELTCSLGDPTEGFDFNTLRAPTGSGNSE